MKLWDGARNSKRTALTVSLQIRKIFIEREDISVSCCGDRAERIKRLRIDFPGGVCGKKEAALAENQAVARNYID